jgi:hypothetical protein
MERGVYFDAWFPRQHCYHPSLPARRSNMVEDLVEYRSTVLVWSALGGGSISLPYLEQEAFGEIDPRFRFYGFMNDAEFIEECQKHGIKVFGIVFEVQGWEFPVELNEEEDRILALNELRGAGKRGWLGLREFSQNRYPKLWPSFETYFPGGLVNSDGEQVTDLMEECCSRDIHGEPCHAHWVEVPDNGQYCYTMDRNNPVWRDYLKAIIRIQIDAGVDGVQLDEAELPMTTLQYGGCFCKDCMKGFRAYLQALPAHELPEDLKGEDLETFHYGEFLKARGYDFKTGRESSPLYWDYIRFQCGQITNYFGELADYAREYAASKGREVLVSGNFFNLLDQYYALEPKVDMIFTEMRNTRFRQPEWYRHVHGFAGDKPVVVVENPYGGVVPELVDRLDNGRGYDLFRMSLYEGAALGANMSVPYGAWMGSIQEHAWYPPHDLCVEIQTFLADNERFFGPKTWSDTAVIYSIESNFFGWSKPDEIANNTLNIQADTVLPFWSVTAGLSSAAQPYDVVFFPEGQLRKDSLTPDDLSQYRTIILPGCHALTDHQAGLLVSHLERGGRLIADRSLGANLPGEMRGRIVDHANATIVETVEDLTRTALAGERQIEVTTESDLAINLVRTSEGAALHIIRYDYREDEDRVPVLDTLELSLSLPGSYDRITCVDPKGTMSGELFRDGDRYRLNLTDVPIYGIVELSGASEGVQA